jgi:murein DD-endopeptidase MepM/ murein hydrolase activator NlpD
MNPNLRKRQIFTLVIAILLLAMLACSVTSPSPVKTAVAHAGETALAAGQQAAMTEAAHLVETARVVAPTEAAHLLETAQVAGPTELAQLVGTAQVAGATAAFSALQTVLAGTYQLGQGGYPMFRLPVSGPGLTTSTGSDLQTGPDQFAVDYSMPVEGAPVYPSLAGIIVYSGCDDPVYGCSVVIRHQDQSWNAIYYSIYTHLQAGSLTTDGTLVDGGSPIGSMGQTGTGGLALGIHLHFAVRTSDRLQQGLPALTGEDMTAFDFQPYIP